MARSCDEGRVGSVEHSGEVKAVMLEQHVHPARVARLGRRMEVRVAVRRHQHRAREVTEVREGGGGVRWGGGMLAVVAGVVVSG